MDRLYDILNGLIKPFGKVLWEGTWSNGNITVPDTSKYLVFLIIQGGAPVIAVLSDGVVRGFNISGNATSGNYNQYIRTFGASVSGNTWTLSWAKQLSHITNSAYHTSGETQSVTKVVGLVPNWGGS